jgi:DNA-binding transcriptional regulator YhcF (GntR family)
MIDVKILESDTNGGGIKFMNEILTHEKSIYLQICEMIENDILREILLEEERIPSTNELAKQYSINPATAAKGINILVEKEVIYKKRGIGMFVTAGAKEKIKDQRKEDFYVDYIKKLLLEAGNIGITKEDVIRMIEKA